MLTRHAPRATRSVDGDRSKPLDADDAAGYRSNRLVGEFAVLRLQIASSQNRSRARPIHVELGRTRSLPVRLGRGKRSARSSIPVESARLQRPRQFEHRVTAKIDWAVSLLGQLEMEIRFLAMTPLGSAEQCRQPYCSRHSDVCQARAWRTAMRCRTQRRSECRAIATAAGLFSATPHLCVRSLPFSWSAKKVLVVSEPSLKFPKSAHLCRGADYARVYARKCKASTDHLLVFADFNEVSETRCGPSVSKKNGSAVKRNLIKRRMREAFRHERALLPVGLDLILIPKKSIESTLADYRTSLKILVPKLALRLASQRPQAEPVSQ